MGSLFDWLILSSVPGVGSTRLKVLVEYFGSPEGVLRASFKELMNLPFMDRKTAIAIREKRDELWVKNQLSLIKKFGAKVITFKDPDYPENLRSLPFSPPLLYVRGEILPDDKYAVAVVGARAATNYGKLMAENLSKGLAESGLTIVSGMARGIDSSAHRATLLVNRRTIAVLGCGVDVVYPPENRELRDKIIERGAVISELPMGSEPLAGNFPKRNRIISGLSLGVVVVEAAAKSGVFSTVKWALEQGREVFAVPGNVLSRTSAGTNRLIKQGAKLIENIEDILEELKFQVRKKESEVKQDLNLSEEEKKIYERLKDSPLHVDSISEIFGFSPAQTLSLLLSLELKGAIKQLPGKMFIKV